MHSYRRSMRIETMERCRKREMSALSVTHRCAAAFVFGWAAYRVHAQGFC